ncbi:toll/interleukin-1 receptor domain-containing protein [Streptomyces sp. NPDC048484]|uniref:toll/interleukin-1 receptor domain-containing protein n=1 Tax=Streptomyces sp. NPDC048484 TaxID=3155146 RepID=UPI00343A6B53
MKVFISWSGPQSQHMAESLKSWLKYVIQTVDPFVSSVDIAKGDRPLPAIATQLEQTSFGIVCVTRDNSQKPWINFEAGALSKAVGDARVIPCLLDLPISDLTGPLAQFQVVSSNNKNDVFAMILALRDQLGLSDLEDNRLRVTFDLFWPALESELEAARAMQVSTTAVTPIRETGDILEEVLILARRQDSVLRTIVERVDSSVPMLELRGRPDTRRDIVDDLITALALPSDSALTYRVISDRVPEEIQVVYDAQVIGPENAEQVSNQAGEFAHGRYVHVAIKSMDGYQIIAGPGKEPVLLPPPEKPPASPGAGSSPFSASSPTPSALSTAAPAVPNTAETG